MTRRYQVTVRGKWHLWAFDVVASPEHAEDWRRDGLEVDEIVNSIPAWWPWPRAWCRIEDFLRLRWLGL